MKKKKPLEVYLPDCQMMFDESTDLAAVLLQDVAGQLSYNSYKGGFTGSFMIDLVWEDFRFRPKVLEALTRLQSDSSPKVRDAVRRVLTSITPWLN